MALAMTAVIVYCYPHGSKFHYKYKVGQAWSYAKLVAPYDIDIYPDTALVRAGVDSIRASHVPIYHHLDINVDSIIGHVDHLLAAVPDSVARRGFMVFPDVKGYTARVNAILRAAYTRGIYPDSIVDLSRKDGYTHLRLAITPTEITKVSLDSLTTALKVFNELDRAASAFNCHNVLINSGVNNVLIPSVGYDTELNASLIDQAIAEVKAPRRRIVKDETIVDNGTVVTPEIYNWLQNYERAISERAANASGSATMMLLGQVLYVLLLTSLLLYYIHTYNPRVWFTTKSMLFVLVLIGLFTVFEAVAGSLLPGRGLYMVPVAIVPVLVLVYLDSRMALMAGMTVILLSAPLATFPLEYIVVQFVAMTVAVYTLRDLTRRSQLLRTSAFVIAAYWLAYLALTVMNNGSLAGFKWGSVAALALSGVLTAMAYVLMSLIERLFGFISNVTLVELADTNNDLLRQLSDECPGTFQHSIAVSNLAAEAARLIGANALLTRAGALYHDIGKLKNPVFFTENQHGVNPHDGLSPVKSAEIIISHVTEGLKRADKAGLPRVIRDFIAQHHGAGQAKYFYYTYCKAHPDENVDTAPFTYPGPNPQTREASVMMMADAVEAASRSLKEHTPEAITTLVNRIIDGQIADGLHNDSTLSFKDVSVIKDTFIRRLMTMYHSRISYPEGPKK